MSKELKTVFLFIILFLQQLLLIADIRLPSIIGSNMVIQQNANIPIWGWANPGEQVSVQTSWQATEITTVANDEGEWMVKLNTPTAGGAYTIRLTANSNEVVLDNVLCGEVWVASGQSNMAMSLKNCENAEMEIAAASYPEIRLFHIERTSSSERQSDCKGTWKETTPESVKDFSGVAYFFGRKIYSRLNVPIGLISASKGGSPVEAWIAERVLKSDADFSPVFDMWEQWEEKYPESESEYQQELKAWEKEKERAEVLKVPVSEQPSMPEAVWMIKRPHKRPGNLYNAMVAPIMPYGIKGVIWYQGEENVYRPSQYEKLFRTLIMSWRKEWKRGDFPFYFVQIAPYRYEKDLHTPSLLRDAQSRVMSFPNTGMVVTTDIGNVDDIHPKNKQDVGKRVALWALAKTYGYDMVYSGPVYRSMKVEGGAIRLYFDQMGSGLVCRGDSLTDFEIAGPEKEFIPANAIIDDSTVIVTSSKIKNPVAVRFGWSIVSTPNFFNKEGLPAAPFRTDTLGYNRK